MRLDLGNQTYDLTARALVVGAVEEGADLADEAVAHLGQIGHVREIDPGTAQILTTDDVPTMAVSVVLGCRLIRTHEVRAARRVCDVLASVWEAQS